jgi:hypothetical protein
MNTKVEVNGLDFQIPSKVYEQISKHFKLRQNRILFVVDDGITLDPGALQFGVERVVRLIRESTVGLWRFSVDTAELSNQAFSVVNNPTGALPKYLGFKFDSVMPSGELVINSYDQIWCFGLFGPAPTDDALGKLTTWMNNGGGLFATGDHDNLGESMCGRIPRAGTMRAWSAAQGVPPGSGLNRIDTHRPETPEEIAGIAVISGGDTDAVPQKISWATWQSHWHFPFRLHRRPHPILCHPQLGPIDVMPDHNHEGVVFDYVVQPGVGSNAAGLAAITLTNDYNFNGIAGEEYPTMLGQRPLPRIIAYGNTLADPPLQHIKSDSPAKRFAMISVYDGHDTISVTGGIGRVATDSTWHHWMNLNISEIEAVGGANWEKIKRYYINLAIWLAPKPEIILQANAAIIASFYTYPGIEELTLKRQPIELGVSLRDHLHHHYGACWVTTFLRIIVTEINPKFAKIFDEQFITDVRIPGGIPPILEPSISSPSPDAIEVFVLGGIAQAILKTLDGEKESAGRFASLKKLNAERLQKVFVEGAADGLKQFSASHSKDAKRTQKLFSNIA